ncbi:MAG: fructose bisphosphate aldolase [Candidatus Nanopelagicus sp.]
MDSAQFAQMKSGKGFIAALDQSGGSTPKALSLYGIEPGTYSGDEAMFDLVHQMRTRIIKSASFTSERVIGVILFEMTMDRKIDGMGSAEYLWQKKQIVPFLKVDNGLADEKDGAQVMKPIPELEKRLSSAISHGVFGTKMRSVIKQANQVGVNAVVNQQFEIGKQICAKGLVPIIEPEVDIKCPDKAAAEDLLLTALTKQLDALGSSENVMLKLTLPDKAGLYSKLADHPRVVRVVALSGGYSRDHANEMLAKNPKLIASFSRALTEGLTAQQNESEFDAKLGAAIEGIYQASVK